MRESADTPQDEELAARLVRGEAAALTELMQRYRRPLYGYLHRMLASAEDAEDLFQETFMRVIRHISRFDTGRRFKPWLYAIATNLVRNKYRSRGYRETVPLDRTDDEGGGSLSSRLAGRASQPSERLEREEARVIVRDAVDALPERGRAALILYYYQGLSYEEVSATLEIPLGTVKSRIHNSMARLDKVLSRQEEVL